MSKIGYSFASSLRKEFKKLVLKVKITTSPSTFVTVYGEEPFVERIRLESQAPQGSLLNMNAVIVQGYSTVNASMTNFPEALFHAKNAQPVVFLHGYNLAMMGDYPEWFALNAYPSLIGLLWSVSITQIRQALDGNKKAQRTADMLAQNLLSIPFVHVKVIEALDFMVGTTFRKAEVPFTDTWIPLAKHIFGELPIQELCQRTQGLFLPSAAEGFLKGYPLDDQLLIHFTDLFDQSGTLRHRAHNRIIDLAKKSPITVLVDLETAYQKDLLRSNHIYYKILPAVLFKGTQVGKILSAISKNEFFQRYNICCDEYCNI